MSLNPKTFSCSKCGQCCRMIVKLNQKDINRIKKLGHKEEDFVMNDPLGAKFKVLKQKNAICVFVKKENNNFVCSIYAHRPGVCKKYPFMKLNCKIEDCKPKSWERWPKIWTLVD